MIGWLWEVGGLMCNYPQSYKISLILLILYCIKPSRMKSWDKNFLRFFPSHSLLTILIFIFSKFLSCFKFCINSFLLLLRFVFWISKLVPYVLMGRLLFWVIQIWRNVLLLWIYVYLIWNIKDLRLSTSKCERVEKLRKHDT